MIEKPPVRRRRARPRRWHQRLLSPVQRRILVLFLVLWLVAVSRFFVWWFANAKAASAVGLVVTTCVISFTLLLPVWLFFTAFRASVPRVDAENGQCRIAMIVTKAPSEPWPMVRHTIEAMLNQETSRPYDVWLADEDPTDVTVRWCAANDVLVSTRRGVSDYQRDSWPRRKRCKEGNLAYFYDRWGYDRYDIVCQFDADHVPTSDYLRQVMRGFSDPQVGYVAAPSICSSNAETSWTARGRLHKEASLHGLLQAGHNRGFGPTCIGSHYSVRTKALRDIGGVGPELAEDFSTSYLMSAHGWKGMFSIDVTAVGEGPRTFLDGMTQELQWSRSLTTFFLRYSRGHWRNLSNTERFRFAFAQMWYPLFAGHLLIASLLAPLAAVTNRPWVDVTVVDYISHAAVPTFAILALMIWFRRNRWFRPTEAPIISWESVLFQLTRWPWNVLGVAQGVLGTLLGKEFSFRVTPKTGSITGVRPTIILPYLMLVVSQAAVVFLTPNASNVLGYIVLTAAGAGLYALVSFAVVALHMREARGGPMESLRSNALSLLLSVGALGMAGIALERALGQASAGWSVMPDELIGANDLQPHDLMIYGLALFALLVFTGWGSREKSHVPAKPLPDIELDYLNVRYPPTPTRPQPISLDQSDLGPVEPERAMSN